MVGGKVQAEVGTASTFMYGALVNGLVSSGLMMYCHINKPTTQNTKKDR